DEKIQDWAVEHGIEDIVKNSKIFWYVEKYHKSIEPTNETKNPVILELPPSKQQKIEELKKNLPYEDIYFRADYDPSIDVFLIRKKSPMQTVLDVWSLILIVWAGYRYYF